VTLVGLWPSNSIEI
jgi:hypothetical protein